MFDQLTPEENDTLRGMMLDAVTKSAKLASFAAPSAQLWERAHGVLTDCCDTIYELVASIVRHPNGAREYLPGTIASRVKEYRE